MKRGIPQVSEAHYTENHRYLRSRTVILNPSHSSYSTNSRKKSLKFYSCLKCMSTDHLYSSSSCSSSCGSGSPFTASSESKQCEETNETEVECNTAAISIDNCTDDTCPYSPQSIPPAIILRRALSFNEAVGEDSWLSSSLIDLAFTRFAKIYHHHTRFLSVDFSSMSLSGSGWHHVTDITGQKIDYNDTKRPIIFIFNANNIHWNLIRVVFEPYRELQLFEPMGMPTHRRSGLNIRSVPRNAIGWLDQCWPMPDESVSWINVGISAITTPHQLTSFDCGVACLLYAEKCGQGESKEMINYGTSQSNITEYRKILQEFLTSLMTDHAAAAVGIAS